MYINLQGRLLFFRNSCMQNNNLKNNLYRHICLQPGFQDRLHIHSGRRLFQQNKRDNSIHQG